MKYPVTFGSTFLAGMASGIGTENLAIEDFPLTNGTLFKESFETKHSDAES